MTFTVLSDDQVRAILESLNLDELEEFRHVLASALHEYSAGSGQSEGSLYQQPHRVSTLHPVTKATTLFMPSCGPGGIGFVSLTTPTGKEKEKEGPSNTRPTGIVNLFSPDGRPTGLIHASTLTAFRTALASSCLVARRNHVKTITVFGSGLQAYWHVRLALMMRGSSIKHVNVINRRFSDNAGGMLKQFAHISSAVKEREGWAQTSFTMLTPTFHEYDRLQKEYIRAADIIYCCTPSREDLFDGSILTSHEGRRKGRLIIAVGSYTPEMREIPQALLHQAAKQDRSHRHFHKHADEGGVIVVDTLQGALKEAGEIISANIHPSALVELGELVMLHRLAVEESDAETNSISRASTDEIDKADLTHERPAMATVYGDKEPRASSPAGSASSEGQKSGFRIPFRRSSHGSSESDRKKKEDGLSTWLRDGTVVYKSVGLGLMDLVVGSHLIKFANEKQVGTRIPGF
ncbi:hypothetical protein S40285_04145 [Stachybotrys chlorohalonatus IBT 40285]|uniref:Ornithine cyclodeaminase n=1 Tax=Stachybotrys chlorohalonatus (strain IBT 40285) TaxID=1283841 RepID=A0A084QI18_STAC4|nr:hypothetical protein S40285_04145 [Stachybotrys chlorohalonata IBT 40285]